MQVSPTKATWFGFAWCALAALPLACRGGPAQADGRLCANDGVVSSRRDVGDKGVEIAAEIVTSGCRDCSHAARSGALPGAPCSAASVCAEFCCDCSGTSPELRYRARVCRGGTCADATAACQTARSAIRPDVCQAF